MIERRNEWALRERLDSAPVLALLGSRQEGKTTLARELRVDKPKRYLDFERPILQIEFSSGIQREVKRRIPARQQGFPTGPRTMVWGPLRRPWSAVVVHLVKTANRRRRQPTGAIVFATPLLAGP